MAIMPCPCHTHSLNPKEESKMYQAQHVMALNEIAEQCRRIQNYCEAEYGADVAEAVVLRAQTLEGYMAISGKMWADAKYHFNDMLQSVFMKAVKEGLSASMATSTLNKYIDALCKDYSHLVDTCERLNRTTTHQLDVARSLISKHKAEYEANKYNNYGTPA